MISDAAEAKKVCDHRQEGIDTVENALHKRIDSVEKHVETTLDLLTPVGLPAIPETSGSSEEEQQFGDSVTSLPLDTKKKDVKEVAGHTETTVLPPRTKEEAPIPAHLTVSMACLSVLLLLLK